MSGPTVLNGVETLGNYTYTEILEQNLASFFDWGFINAGGFSNVGIPTSGAYSGDFSRLRPVTDPRYTNGRVWEAARMNWVWETGIATTNQPVSISGVFVGSTFYPTSGGTFHIDYPHGRVVFNTGVAVTSNVKVAYSHKWVNVTSTTNVPWLRLAQTSSYRVDNSKFLIGSGDYALLGESRMQFPTVAIEVADEQLEGYQIGGNQYIRNRVNFFVIGEDKNSVDRLANIINLQHEKTIYLYDSNRLAASGKFPLNHNGSPNTNFITYPTMVAYSGDGGYRMNRGVLWGKLSFIDSQVQPRQELTSSLYQRAVTLTTEAILTSI